jgi:hypothetical protein
MQRLLWVSRAQPDPELPTRSGVRVGRALAEQPENATFADSTGFSPEQVRSARQLRFYEKLPVDLVAYYRSKALNVVHIDAPIMRKPPLSDQHLKEVWEAYQELQVDGCHT